MVTYDEVKKELLEYLRDVEELVKAYDKENQKGYINALECVLKQLTAEGVQGKLEKGG